MAGAVARQCFLLAREASLCHVAVASACPQGGKVQGRREAVRIWGELLLTRTGEQDGLIAQEGDPAVSKHCDFVSFQHSRLS